MIKRIFSIIIVIILIFMLCACGHYEHNIVHITDSKGNCSDISIDVYYKESDGIKCYWNNYHESAFFSDGTYVLFKDRCLICNQGN